MISQQRSSRSIGLRMRVRVMPISLQPCIRRFRGGRDDDDAGQDVGRVIVQMAQHLEPVRPRQEQVEDDHSRMEFADRREAVDAVIRALALQCQPFDDVFEQPLNRHVIFNDEHVDRGMAMRRGQ